MSDILDNKIIGLEGLAFETEIDKNVFIEWLDKHDHIKPSFINRNDLGNKSFILEGNENGEYELKIAIDIKNIELYNLSVYLEKELGLEYFGSIERFQNKVKILTSTLIKSGKLTLEETKEILSENNIEIDDNIFETSTNFTFSEIKEIISQINQMSGENILENGNYKKLTKQEIKSVALKMLQQLLFTQAHNRGVDELGGIKTMTQDEVRELYNEYGLDNKEINLKKYINENGELDGDLFDGLEEEILLSERIGIDKLKLNLIEVREKGNQKEIEKLELEYSNKIIKVLYENYAYNSINNKGYTKDIKKDKALQCVGFSMLGHRFLQELGIKHNGIEEYGHSTISVNIGIKKYYFDATAFNMIYEYKAGEKIGEYRNLILSEPHSFVKPIYGKVANIEDILQLQILENLNEYKKAFEFFPNSAVNYNNLGNFFDLKGDNINAKEAYIRSIKYGSLSLEAHLGVGEMFEDKGEFDKAVEIYREWINKDPSLKNIYKNLGDLFYEKNKIKETILNFRNIMSQNFNNYWAYSNVGLMLEYKKDYNGAISMFKQSLEMSIDDLYLYYGISSIFYKNKNKKLGNISKLIYDLTEGKLAYKDKIKYYFIYNKEYKKINNFIKNKDFSGLKDYYFSLLDKEGF